MTRTFRILMCAAALAVAGASAASAQTIDAGEVMFHWGPLHMAPGQVLALNVELTDHFGDPLTVPVELHVEDKNGAGRRVTDADHVRRTRDLVRHRPRDSCCPRDDPRRRLRGHRSRDPADCHRVSASAFRPACRRQSIA